MNDLLRAFLFSLALLLCSNASAQISYDGYENLWYEIVFEQAGESEREFKLLFDAKDDRGGRSFRAWIRPGGYFLGCRVTFEQGSNSSQTAIFHSLGPYRSVIRIPLWTHGGLNTSRGMFALAGRGDATAIAHIGDSFTIAGTTATLRSLSAFEAGLELPNSKTPVIFPISSTGQLRSEHHLLHKEFYQLQREQWRADSFREEWLLIRGVFIFLFAAYVIVYGFILVGWITRDEHLERRNTNNRKG